MSEILFENRGPIGLATLNRPEALNALSLDMVAAFRARLAAWAGDASVAAVVVRGAGDKAFCAGGDVRALAARGPEHWRAAAAFFAEEYRLNQAIKRFPKPYVALMDGVVMGGGAGVSIHGDYRVGGDRTVFAMPETAIGMIPDIGASFFLPRLPRQLGLHLGLTGARLDAADCVTAHLIDYYVRSERMETLLEAMVSADYAEDADETLCEILAMNAAAPATPALKAHSEEIDEAYSGETLEAVLTALEGGSAWAQEQARIIRSCSPTATRVAFRLLRQGAEDVEAALIQEYRAACFAVRQPDFYEGVTAALEEKRAPVWAPGRLEEVSEADVAAAFAPLGGEDLSF